MDELDALLETFDDEGRVFCCYAGNAGNTFHHVACSYARRARLGQGFTLREVMRYVMNPWERSQACTRCMHPWILFDLNS